MAYSVGLHQGNESREITVGAVGKNNWVNTNNWKKTVEHEKRQKNVSLESQNLAKAKTKISLEEDVT